MVIPSLFLRGCVAVIVAVALSLIAEALDVPVALFSIVCYALVFAIPCVYFAMWFALLYRRVRHADIDEFLAPGRGHIPLMYMSLAGYVVATVASIIGVLASPEAFP